ncbi:MBL fold metallo-hydrolase [Pseudoalteromonas sp. KAN5]|uniref:MBL fold metallo-hydrolase n=1 Tax=Pseudoalteromonas sp. KAN5 TaxID=2916633 RepID=UPI001FCC7E0F|nr:MBL fold metallo-hydrolase [Pseudoalteromonas sp. KAN5]
MTHYFYSPMKFITFLLLSCFCVAANTTAAPTQWRTISANVQFLEQSSNLRFYDSNQVLIQGDKCALMFDASGDFAAVETTIEHLKNTLTTPLCYLVASHFHDDHLLGMAILQHHYPDAQLIVHQQLATEFQTLQKAYSDKLDSYEKSIELSLQRLSQQPEAQQQQWRDKLNLAKQRLLRWRQYQLQAPNIPVSQPLTLELGNYPVTINAYQAHTNADLTLSAENHRILVGADLVDWLPYPGHGNFNSWIKVLSQLHSDKRIKLILPGHGGVLKVDDLQQPLSFLQAIEAHVLAHPQQDLTQLEHSFDQQFAKDYQIDEISKKAYPLFLQAGLKRAKQSK